MKRIFKYLKYHKDKKGIALVWMALMLTVLFMLAGLAIDIGYMYYVKNQLQVAADAAALAGAAELTGAIDNSTLNPNVLDQEEARQEAWRFACKNTAAGSNVYLATNTPSNCNTNNPPSASELNGGNTDGGDIVVGNWSLTCPSGFTCGIGQACEPAGSGYFCRATGSTGLPINALQTKPRRTGETSGMPRVSLFLGRAFGWSVMSAAASTIATGRELVTLNIPLCLNKCNGLTNFNDGSCPGEKFILNPAKVIECQIAWLNPLDYTKQPNTSDIRKYLKNPTSIDLCGKCVKSKQGGAESILSDVEDAFNSHKKTETIKYTDEANPTNNWEATIEGWRVLVPVFEVAASVCGMVGPNPCPGDQPDPYYVGNVAEVIITNVDKPPSDSCPTCEGEKRTGITLIGTQPIPTPKVTQLRCLVCGHPDIKKLVGTVKLVK